MSDTPRTDAYRGTHETHRINGKTIYGHAAQLERENAKLKQQRDELLEALKEMVSWFGYMDATPEEAKAIMVARRAITKAEKFK